jgi:uncharacterized protein
LLLSPPLVVPPDADAQLVVFDADEQRSMAHWLQTLDADSEPLLQWMAQRHEARIGRYAERLLEFYLTHGPVHTLAAAHVPLRSLVNGVQVTHGELDFLLTDAHGKRLHWELAVKFFLCTASTDTKGTADTATPADFIGPNGVETLAHKWHKLFAKQLTRAQAHALPAPWEVQQWQPQAFTRGWMFYRWGQAVPQCAALHPAHGKGWWTDYAQMRTLPQAHYAFLPRLHWMAQLSSIAQLGEQAVVLARDAMQLYLHSLWASSVRSNDALMIVQLDANADVITESDARCEVQRFFVHPPPKQ